VDPESGADPPPFDEARRLIASARALLRELVEEDIHSFDRQPLEPPQPAAPPATDTRGVAPKRDLKRPASPAGEPAPIEPPPPGVAETPPWAQARPSLEEVRDHLGDCQRCGLCKGRRKIVFGDGHPEAKLMFVGEGPGEQEDRQGLPFVGRAGELLTQMIEKGIGIPRSDVYICNIVKCRPPQNRTPLPPEVSACRPFLDGQIRAIAPRVIVTLGKPAASLLLDREVAITRLRGSWQEYRGIPLMPTLHPAYVLRQYTPENRRAVWQDLQAAFERSQD
jgi:DNA polymerase